MFCWSFAFPLSLEAGTPSGNLKTPGDRVTLARNPSRGAFGGSLGASRPFSRHSPFRVAPCKFSPAVAALETEGDANDYRHPTRKRPQAARNGPHGRVSPGATDRRRPRIDGSPRWHCHGRGGWRDCGRCRPDQLACAHWPGVDDNDGREGAVAISSVPPGSYTLEIALEGFARTSTPTFESGQAPPSNEPSPDAGSAGRSIVVHGSGSLLDARDPGFGTRFGAEYSTRSR